MTVKESCREFASAASPSAPASTLPDVLVREWQDGCEVECALLVRGVELRTKRDGAEYLKLQLGDRSGAVAAMIWEDVASLREICRGGCVVRVRGRYTVHPRYGPQLNLLSLRAAESGEYVIDDLLDGPPRTADQMEADLRELLATVRNPFLSRLLEAVFGPASPVWCRFREAPAAKHYHQAYRHGLLEHCLTVAQSVSAISATFPGIDRDIAVTGALLHDIGKLEAYSADPQAIDLTDAGRLQGEIPLGYYRVRRAIEDIAAFPPALAEAVLHIILAHHGSLEHGSPVVPCTREATLVHMIDNLGGRLGSFDRLEKELPAGAVWSSWDKALGAGAYFAGREAA
ncbi:MAG: 3-5 exoribonuclease [Solirubrobacteraceae bacterium]|nr:3-5 exoribonuclease [Solirubrobacteraceae bacterium]